MKVRWTTGSIRFRITPSELEALQFGRPVGVALPVPGGGWIVTLQPAGRAGAESAVAGDGRGGITITLPAAEIDRLAEPETEGIYFLGPLGDASTGLRYFVEKDFPCVHPRPVETGETESETFAAPSGFADRHRRGGGECS